jgi:hypothetical protein
VVAALVGMALAPAALADDWLPHPADATWTYEWTDTVYNTVPTKEKVTVKEQSGANFTLAWTTAEQGNDAKAPTSTGQVAFQESASGLVNTDWSSGFPPAQFPILCASATGCNNSLASTYYLIIWGSRAPVLASPLLRGTSWNATGGAQNDVASENEYVGQEKVSVPAFPEPVLAAKVRSEVSQAGALGDPYGSGIRTVWWVYGVGPVKVTFQHAGPTAPITTSVLVSTNQVPKATPTDQRYWPLAKGLKLRYRWTNTKHLKQASVQDFTLEESVNGSVRYSAKHVSGPIRLAAAYGFTTRSDGTTSLWSVSKSATISPFPPLGPSSAPKAKRRRFATPFDLLVFGFNPVLPAVPVAGQTWKSIVPSRDYTLYGVTGETKVVGFQTVTVKAGTFKNALVVRSTLEQKGFPFGSGTRTAIFAPGKGLVKLTFEHGDGSVSVVELVK